MRVYYDEQTHQPIYFCEDGETIYKKNNNEYVFFAYRDINDNDFSWYKNLDEEPFAFENNGGVFLYKNKKLILYYDDV